MTGAAALKANRHTTLPPALWPIFIAPKGPGFEVGKKFEKLGYKAIDSAELVMEDYRIPADQLIGGSLQIKLEIRTQEGYAPNNDVKGFKATSGSVPTPAAASAPAQTAAAAPAASGKAAPPWAKR